MRRGVVESMLELVGETPLVLLRCIGSDRPRARIVAKVEAWNPSGSSTDRIAHGMTLAAEREGRLVPGGEVVAPSSGDLGIALALLCGSRGYKCTVLVPESVSLERLALLRSYGAEVIATPAEEQLEGATARARVLATERGAALLDPFADPANPAAHAASTAVEIVDGLGGVAPDAFVAGVGSGGTLTGVGRALRARGAATKIIGVEPVTSATVSRGEHGPSKIAGLAPGFVPGTYDASVVDEIRTVSDRDAWDTRHALATREGLLVGISSGATTFIALQLAAELGVGKTVVAFFADSGERDFSLGTYFDDSEGVAPGAGAMK